MEYLIYIICVGTIGSIAAFLKSEKKGIKELFFRLVDGCFSAYITYEFAFYYTKSEHLSLALCGLGAFMGSGLFGDLKNIIFEKLKDKLKD